MSDTNTQLDIKTVLFQTIQFSVSTRFNSIWSIYTILSGATTPGQSGAESNGNEGILHILQISSIWSISIRLFSVISVYSLGRRSPNRLTIRNSSVSYPGPYFYLTHRSCIWSLTIRLFSVKSGHSFKRWSYPSAEVQSVYSTTSAKWAKTLYT